MDNSQQTIVADDSSSAELHSFLTGLNGTITIDNVARDIYSYYSEIEEKYCSMIPELHVAPLSKLIGKSKISIIFVFKQRYSQM